MFLVTAHAEVSPLPPQRNQRGHPLPKIIVEKEKTERETTPSSRGEDQVKERRQRKLFLGIEWYRCGSNLKGERKNEKTVGRRKTR